jgi:hypothetical protein
MKSHLIPKLIFLCIIFFAKNRPVLAQAENHDSTYRRHFIGSSLFVLVNFFPDPPSFYQLNYGYRLTPKDVLSIEAITWTYHAPLGIPYGPSHKSPEESYPGSIRGTGLGLAYQRYLWKNFYSAVHTTPFLQTYRNDKKEKIQNGFQLFCTLRFGFHLKLFRNRFFLEPSAAITYWPINTNMPESFAKMESKWPNYFLFEPGLHFGMKF